MRRLVEILDLFLTLERFDERFLRQVLSIVDVAYDPVDLKEDPAEVFLNEALLGLPFLVEIPASGSPEYLAASLIVPPGRDWPAIVICPKNN